MATSKVEELKQYEVKVGSSNIVDLDFENQIELFGEEAEDYDIDIVKDDSVQLSAELLSIKTLKSIIRKAEAKQATHIIIEPDYDHYGYEFEFIKMHK